MTEQTINYLEYPVEYREVCEAIEDDIKTYHEQVLSVVKSGGLHDQLAYIAQIIEGKVKPNDAECMIAKIGVENILWMATNSDSSIFPVEFWETRLGSFLMQAIWLLHDGEWLTVIEAQELTGKSQSGFSQWYKRAGIQAYLSPDGRLAFLRGDIEAAINAN